jgi:hypothetical protein
MKCTKFFLLFIFFVYSTKSIAQNFELGKVTIAELQEKRHSKDSTANAAVLFKKGSTYFVYSNQDGFTLKMEVTLRIKIYKKEGYDWANQIVNFRSGNSSSHEKVYFSNAVTYNLVDGKIEKTKLKGEGEFDELINKYWSRKKITMPNIREGSVIEYKYTIETDNLSTPRDWYFQSSIPVNFVEYKIAIPEYYVYNTQLKGFFTPKTVTETSSRQVYLNDKEKNCITCPSRNTNTKFDYLETKTTYSSENIPAIKDEAFINNIDNYTFSLVQELSMTNYPNQPLKYYATNWDSVVKSIYDYSDFGSELDKTGYFEDDLKPILAGITSSEQKIDAVLSYVKSVIKWNNYTGYGCNDGVKKAYKDKTGNVGEINLMLTAMLRFAGLNANPVLISTRDNGIALFPSRTAFNHVIAAVEIPEGNLLLDATEKYAGYNVLPFNDLNWIGRLIRKDGTSEEIDLMPKKISNDVITMNYSIDSKGLISGKLRRQLTDYNALAFRNKVEDVKEDTYLEKLENENDKIEIKEYSRTNEKELKLPVTETFSFTGSNLTEIIGDKMYINPMLFYTRRENPFKQEIREYPIDYGYSFLDKYVVNIQIPEGYQIETMPASGIFSMQDDLGTFKFMTNSSGNTINVIAMHQINTPIISSEYYDMLKEFYQKMIDKQNEKIVLVKI